MLKRQSSLTVILMAHFTRTIEFHASNYHDNDDDNYVNNNLSNNYDSNNNTDLYNAYTKALCTL